MSTPPTVSAKTRRKIRRKSANQLLQEKLLDDWARERPELTPEMIQLAKLILDRYIKIGRKIMKNPAIAAAALHLAALQQQRKGKLGLSRQEVVVLLSEPSSSMWLDRYRVRMLAAWSLMFPEKPIVPRSKAGDTVHSLMRKLWGENVPHAGLETLATTVAKRYHEESLNGNRTFGDALGVLTASQSLGIECDIEMLAAACGYAVSTVKKHNREMHRKPILAPQTYGKSLMDNMFPDSSLDELVVSLEGE